MASAMSDARSLLSVRDLTIAFGGVTALDNVSFEVAEGRITGLIGPNGAGKTTLFNCLSGLYRPSAGDIQFCGRSIRHLPPHRITALGLGRTFQNLALFGSMSVLDNTRAGAHTTTASGFLAGALALGSARQEEAATTQRAFEILEALDLTGQAHMPATGLPFGTRKRVELARALMAQPRLLLLDEPASGLNHEEVEALGRLLLDIRDRFDLTMLLVEHHMSLVMSVSDHVVTLDFGRKIAEGAPHEIQRDAAVVEAYLGTGAT